MRTTETERRAYVGAFERSGLRLIDFCGEHGLNPKTFYTWRKRYVSDDFIKADFTDEFTFLPLQLRFKSHKGTQTATVIHTNG